jgi:hypothetical protein
LRPLFRRRRELLGELARAGAEAVKELVRHASGEGDARLGIVVSVATAGDLLQWHPHLHLITTDGGRCTDGSWHTPEPWDAERLLRLFRERLLGSLLDKRASSQELVQKLLAWRLPGFSAHVGEPIAAEPSSVSRTPRPPSSEIPSRSRSSSTSMAGAVLYRSRMNPVLGRNFEAMDSLEWLARMSDHNPDPGQHRTLFYGEYSSRARACCQPLELDATSTTPDHPSPKRRCPPSWRRLIAKVYQVDPLVCTHCGRRMSILAFVSDQHSISRILDHLGLRSPQRDRPPPTRETREITRVFEHGEGWGVPVRTHGAHRLASKRLWIPAAPTAGRAPALVGHPRALRRDDVGRRMDEIAQRLPADRGVRIVQPGGDFIRHDSCFHPVSPPPEWIYESALAKWRSSSFAWLARKGADQQQGSAQPCNERFRAAPS